jgi:tetratricopeptide (TPR) repeat protein
LSSQVLLRFALVAVAFAAIAWLALGLRAIHLEAEGRQVLENAQRGEITRSELQEGLDLLRRAQRANPDKDPRLAESVLLIEAERENAAITLAERVMADEPENLEGWLVLYLAAIRTGDRPRAARVLRRIEHLNPQVADGLRGRARD